MTTLSKVIGIISFLPNNIGVRKERFKKLNKLIFDCKRLFNLPVHIIAQNYSKDDIEYFSLLDNVSLDFYNNPLGITEARKKLRVWFLNSKYDYLIMLDDDCEISGRSGKKYLEQIDLNPGCFIEFNKTLLKLFAISKDLFYKVSYKDISPEKEEGFEDRIFVNTLREYYPDKRREFKNTGVTQHSNSTADPLSTWYNNQDLKKMLEETTKIISKLK